MLVKNESASTSNTSSSSNRSSLERDHSIGNVDSVSAFVVPSTIGRHLSGLISPVLQFDHSLGRCGLDLSHHLHKRRRLDSIIDELSHHHQHPHQQQLLPCSNECCANQVGDISSTTSISTNDSGNSYRSALLTASRPTAIQLIASHIRRESLGQHESTPRHPSDDSTVVNLSSYHKRHVRTITGSSKCSETNPPSLKRKRYDNGTVNDSLQSKCKYQSMLQRRNHFDSGNMLCLLVASFEC